uniref:Uncharacterized protein n=1 Tax=Arundo donax TaxID=35708 RepID=A0A0A9BAY7_ARUDO
MFKMELLILVRQKFGSLRFYLVLNIH